MQGSYSIQQPLSNVVEMEVLASVLCLNAPPQRCSAAVLEEKIRFLEHVLALCLAHGPLLQLPPPFLVF